ncbi:MAG: c-type cytochrome [Gammaproteobacteria bacterium]|nr:c-type cytochrome [Gammaproteobacteria bacterium]MBU1723933.1 c-type cytochrome [Gammaproteobacteria bacterium]MBU2006158.1 c-type cytochrome [Gammaproteobacteria bacterium]
MKRLMVSTLFAALSLSTWSAVAEDKPLDPVAGKSLYETYCFMCHDRGLGNAPRPADKADWAKRLPLGEDTLFKGVIDGPSHMYSKGISPVWSEWELRSMISYMMGTVTDADSQKQVNTASAADKERHLNLLHGRKLYEQVCFKCHDYGDLGAPKLGSPETWEERKDKDIDALARSVIDGKGHMYAHGGSNSRSISEFKSMIEYMLSSLEKGWVSPQKDCK